MINYEFSTTLQVQCIYHACGHEDYSQTTMMMPDAMHVYFG